MENISLNTAIITAAGSGKRFGGSVKKQFKELGGIPLLVHSVSVFMNSPYISNIIITAPEDDIEQCNRLMDNFFDGAEKALRIISGGAERQDSIYGALQACPADTDYVFIHDGVRPFISIGFIEELYREVQQYQAVIPGAPLKSTIKLVDSGFAVKTLERSSMMQVFTPQVFNYKLIFEAYHHAYEEGFYSTDDASVLEHYGQAVKIMPASDLNIKITDENDWFLANLLIDKN